MPTDIFAKLEAGVIDASTVVVPLLIIALLVFIHELGHFTAARSVGVRVEEFAIGFGPRLWQKKIGNTIYSIRAFLLGGFVQMFGDLDPSSSVKNESLRNHPESLLSKSLWQKIFVLSAGVFMNFVLGIVLFAVYLSMVNGVVLFKRIGDYKFIAGKEYPALIALSQDFREDNSEYGFILSLNDEIIDSRSELVSILSANENKAIRSEIHTIDGIITRDLVLNGDGVKSNFDLDVFPHAVDVSEAAHARPYISEISTDRGAFHKALITNSIVTLPEGQQTAITVADRKDEFINSYILTIAGEQVDTTKKLDQILRQNLGTTVEMRLLNEAGNVQTVTLTLPAAVEAGKPILGVQLNYSTLGYNEDYFVYQYGNSVVGGVAHAVNTAGYQGYALGVLISRALQGDSKQLTDNVGGVVAIGDQIGGVVTTASEVDTAILVELLNITATISIVLAFMNILPIPVLDGGHILFAILEKLRGKPLPPQIENAIYLVFFVLLVGLSIVVTLRDVVRLL